MSNFSYWHKVFKGRLLQRYQKTSAWRREIYTSAWLTFYLADMTVFGATCFENILERTCITCKIKLITLIQG